jgi:soluble lytic murein transglycosylase-like protein
MGSVFCQRCRWMERNRKNVYVGRRCETRSPRRSLLLTAAMMLLMFEAGLLTSSAVGSLPSPTHRASNEGLRASNPRRVPTLAPTVSAIDDVLKRFEIDPNRRKRVAEAIVRSSSRHNIDPRLIASIMIVESRGDPFAISSRDAVGIMQIHVPTWARTVDQEHIDLFKIEDNVEFGVRILTDYINRYGHDEGIKRYNGWNPRSPEPSTADAYLQKVTLIYRSTSLD